jgi:DNA polymerase III alpha subunit
LALIRPAKRHLIGEKWKTIAETIWDAEDEGYAFKKSHAVAYAHLVCVHINLLCEQELLIDALSV